MDFKAAFSGISTNNLVEARNFYSGVLGLETVDESMGLTIALPGGAELFIYEKADHQPATFTVLNFVVSDIDKAAEALIAKGISFERYDTMPGDQDEKGIMHSPDSAKYGPSIAWFKDPAGNILSILQDS